MPAGTSRPRFAPTNPRHEGAKGVPTLQRLYDAFNRELDCSLELLSVHARPPSAQPPKRQHVREHDGDALARNGSLPRVQRQANVGPPEDRSICGRNSDSEVKAGCPALQTARGIYAWLLVPYGPRMATQGLDEQSFCRSRLLGTGT